jgi:hypothetical protein
VEHFLFPSNGTVVAFPEKFRLFVVDCNCKSSGDPSEPGCTESGDFGLVQTLDQDVSCCRTSCGQILCYMEYVTG